MNLIKKTTLALALLAAAGTSFAQTTTATRTNGLLGTSYTEFNYALNDIDGVSDYGHSLGAKVNVPVVASLLDVGGSYSYDWIRGPVHAHSNNFAAYANAYVPLEGVKPFVGATLGYSWVSLPKPLDDHDAWWNVAFGLEIPLGPLTLTPKIVFSDDFNGRIGDTDDTWTYEVEGHYWFSAKSGAFASVALEDAHRDPTDIWVYKVGLRFRF